MIIARWLSIVLKLQYLLPGVFFIWDWKRLCSNAGDFVPDSLREPRWLYFGMAPISTCNPTQENVLWNRSMGLANGSWAPSDTNMVVCFENVRELREMSQVMDILHTL